MSIRKFRAGRISTVTASQHVGQFGDVFYDESTGQFRVSNGTTPGGTVVATALNLANGTADVFVNNLVVNGTSTTINNIVSNNETTVTGVLTVTGNATFTGNTEFIGATTFIGDTTFLGNITEVGNLLITGRATNNGPSIFNGSMDITGNSVQTGLATFVVATNSMNNGAVTITGNVQGLHQPPALPGVMLHVTGQDDGTTPGRMYVDSNRQYSIIVGRRFNGDITNPAQVTTGEEVFRLAGTGYPTGGWPVTGLAQIRFIADETQTQTNRGGHLDFLTVPIGSNVMTQAMSISATTGVSIAGNLTATGNVYAGNVISNTVGTVYGNVVGTAGAFTGNVSANYLTGKLIRGVRNAGTIADGGTLTINFSTDAIVHCVWGNGLTLAYQNFVAGRVVKVMATKATGTGTDTLNLDGITAAQVSTGSTTVSGTADQTTFIELICTNTSIGGVYIKL